VLLRLTERAADTRDCLRARCHPPRATPFRTSRYESSRGFQSRQRADSLSPAMQLALPARSLQLRARNIFCINNGSATDETVLHATTSAFASFPINIPANS